MRPTSSPDRHHLGLRLPGHHGPDVITDPLVRLPDRIIGQVGVVPSCSRIRPQIATRDRSRISVSARNPVSSRFTRLRQVAASNDPMVTQIQFSGTSSGRVHLTYLLQYQSLQIYPGTDSPPQHTHFQ